MDVDTNLPWHVRKIPFVLIRLARLKVLRGPEDVFLGRHETIEHEQALFVPLVPMLFGGS